jgi:ABC-type Fe3+-hydroxamate transport system substrate-binding protein
MLVRSVTLILVPVLFALGCDRPSPPSDAGAMRIVCLSPALTQMIIDLDMTHALVGVGPHDVAAPPGMPVVGTYTEVNLEALASVAPTHVLLQAGISGPPSVLVERATAGRFKLVAYPYPTTMLDVADTLHPQDDALPTGVGAFLDRSDQAAALRDRMLSQIEAIRRLTAPRPRVRTLMVIYTLPLTVSGGGTVLNDMLEAAGGVNVAPQGATAPALDREKLLGINPDAVLLLIGGGPLGPLDQDDRIAPLRGPGLTAYATGRIYKIDDPQAVLPTTTMPRVIAAMTRALHPDLADAIDAAVDQEATP